MLGPCGAREGPAQHTGYLRCLEKSSEAGTGQAMSQITEGSGELGKSQSTQGPESQLQEMRLHAPRAEGTLGGVRERRPCGHISVLIKISMAATGKWMEESQRTCGLRQLGSSYSCFGSRHKKQKDSRESMEQPSHRTNPLSLTDFRASTSLGVFPPWPVSCLLFPPVKDKFVSSILL